MSSSSRLMEVGSDDQEGWYVISVCMRVETSGPVAAVHLWALRMAARTGHIRRAAIAMRRIFPQSPDALVHFEGGGTLAVPLKDHYWASILVGWEYEPEVQKTIDAAIAHCPDAVLFDCGANIGYWAVRYAARIPVIAIEAVAPTYERLSAAASRNGFQALHAAIWDKSGQSLTVHWHAPADAGGSVTEAHGSNSGSVMSVTLDELHHADPSIAGRIPIVKLDVEGAELQAIDGARELRHRALWVYEDHAREPTHKVTAQFLDLGFDVFYAGGATPQQITSVRQLDAIKIEVAHGYNFVARSADGPCATMRT
jgi:FkbM family methyltransferase